MRECRRARLTSPPTCLTTGESNEVHVVPILLMRLGVDKLLGMRLISWNVAGRVKRLSEQVKALAQREPDLVALQEVTAKTRLLLREEVQRLGLTHVADSFTLARDRFSLTGPRRYGQLIASRWPLYPLPLEDFKVPWQERVLSVVIDSRWGPVEMHTTGVPPGCTNDWIKIQQLEGIYERLGRRCSAHRILCGDFNTPQAEFEDGSVMTWAQEERPDGTITLVGRRAERWDRGERNVLTGLTAHDLTDVFRLLHGYRVKNSAGTGRQGSRHRPSLRPCLRFWITCNNSMQLPTRFA